MWVSMGKEFVCNCLFNKKIDWGGRVGLVQSPFIFWGGKLTVCLWRVIQKVVCWCLVFLEETTIDFTLLNTHKCSSEPLSALKDWILHARGSRAKETLNLWIVVILYYDSVLLDIVIRKENFVGEGNKW